MDTIVSILGRKESNNKKKNYRGQVSDGRPNPPIHSNPPSRAPRPEKRKNQEVGVYLESRSSARVTKEEKEKGLSLRQSECIVSKASNLDE